MDTVRILQVLASLDRGGAETMLMNIYRSIDKDRIQFDFVVNHQLGDYAYESEIRTLGGRIYRIPRFKIYNYYKYRKSWKTLFFLHPEWNVIHGHQTTTALIYLQLANKLNKVTIAHAHTAGRDKSLKGIIKRYFEFPLRWIATHKIACSKPAGEWVFGKKICSLDKCTIINNSIDSKKFVFNQTIRKDIRFKLGFDDKYVIGHIGSFQTVKNHTYVIKIFNKIRKKIPDSLLLLVGDGSLRSNIEAEVKEMGLEDNVIFTGVRSDIPDLLQAMDVFLFPSLYEGLPVTMIEAQASGLPCVISDTISPEVKITDNVEFISLDKSPKYWAERVLSYQTGFIRKDTSAEILAANYDIVENAKMLQDFYLSLANINQ